MIMLNDGAYQPVNWFLIGIDNDNARLTAPAVLYLFPIIVVCFLHVWLRFAAFFAVLNFWIDN